MIYNQFSAACRHRLIQFHLLNKRSALHIITIELCACASLSPILCIRPLYPKFNTNWSALLIETFSFWRWTNFQSRLKLQFTYSHVLYHLADRQTAEDISFTYNWKCVLTHCIRCESDLLRLVSCVYVRHRRKKTHCK